MGDDTLAPVQTIDGQWNGVQNGFSMSMVLQQTGTEVKGVVSIGSIATFVQGEVSGTFEYPTVDLLLDFPGYEQVTYKGTMSATEAVLYARLNRAGFDNVELKVKKR